MDLETFLFNSKPEIKLDSQYFSDKIKQRKHGIDFNIKTFKRKIQSSQITGFLSLLASIHQLGMRQKVRKKIVNNINSI